MLMRTVGSSLQQRCRWNTIDVHVGHALFVHDLFLFRVRFFGFYADKIDLSIKIMYHCVKKGEHNEQLA